MNQTLSNWKTVSGFIIYHILLIYLAAFTEKTTVTILVGVMCIYSWSINRFTSKLTETIMTNISQAIVDVYKGHKR